jgi:hypothetical protein
VVLPFFCSVSFRNFPFSYNVWCVCTILCWSYIPFICISSYYIICYIIYYIILYYIIVYNNIV